MKKEISCGELEHFVEQISNILEDCPLYYLIEVLEAAKRKNNIKQIDKKTIQFFSYKCLNRKSKFEIGF